MQHTPSEQSASTPAAVDASQQKAANPSPELAEAIERGYEPHDVGLRGVMIFLGALVVTLVVVLFAIYGIMMALVERDRTQAQLGSPVTIVRPPEYAPLQPSLEHDHVDAVDMSLMRAQTQAVLESSGVSATGRRFISIDDAMVRVLPLLKKAPYEIPEPTVAPYPPGSMEGKFTGPADWQPKLQSEPAVR